MISVKICGLTNKRDLLLCAGHGAAMLGFVTEYPKSVPWNLTLATAAALIASCPESAATCIVTGGERQNIINLALKTGAGFVQLHFGETLDDTSYIASTLAEHGVKVIKTLFPTTENLVRTAERFACAGVHALLFDPRLPSTPHLGGKADLAAFISLRRAVNIPVILAGGITPANAAKLIESSEATMIDVMTGVEASPGIKSPERVISLFRALDGIHS